MRIIRRDLTKLFLLAFAIILHICPLYVTAQTIRVFSHTEGSNAPPRVLATRVYQNGTVVARIVRSNPTTQNCFDETLSLRVIRPDGSVDEKEIKLNIPQLNYCGTQFLDYQLIRGNHILVTYYNALDPNNVSTYEQWGLIVDFNGKELSKIPFGTQNQVIPNSKVVLNTDREKGFLILAPVRYSSGVIYTDWKQYKIETNGTFTKLTEGLLNFDYFSTSTLTAVVSTVGESYSILNAFTTNTNVGTNQNPLLQQGVIYAMNIGYNQSTVTSTILYQTSTPSIDFTALSCDVAFAGVGQICTLTVVVGSGTYYIEINYLSSGSVGYSNVVNRAISQSFLWKVNNLPFGGYLLTNFTGNSLYGFLFNEGDTNATQWSFAEPEPINSDGIFQILPNNTLLLFKEATGSSWQFHAIDLPRYVNRVDNGYSNINVESTEPAIDASIDSNTISTVSINFYKPVIPSNGQLSIYQVIDNQPNLRQLIPGIACSVVNDGKTVNAEILKSTFGVSNGNYFITIDNSFVKDGAYGENLLGIEDNIWKFTTIERKYSFSPSKAGLFRLTHAGTEFFDNLSKEGRHDFFSKFRLELSLAIPVNPARLTSIEKVQVDRSVNGKQYFISIRIEETKDENDIDVTTIVDYLDVMVNKKSQSPIGSGSVTGYLDETYGFVQLPGIWEKYKTQLIILFFLIMFLFAAYAVALRKTPKPKNVEDTDGDTGKDEPEPEPESVRNTVVLHFGLIVFDLVMDILFVSISAKDFPVLYVLSVVFVTVPIAVNATLAFYIITRENSKNTAFYKWFMDNAKISSIFTVISGANVEALYILKSHLLGIKLFKAPFSEDAEKYIYWGNILNIVIEDIPQVIIQICYYKFALSYGLVPLLTFVSSLLTLTIKLLAPLAKRLYKRIERYTSDKKVD